MASEISPSWNEETLRVIREARQGLHLRGPYHSVEELVADLEEPDNLKTDQEAMEKYQANPVTDTHEEVGKMLG